jgi:hypothetical protein
MATGEVADESQRHQSRLQITREILRLLVRVPWPWIVVVGAAAILSTLRVTLGSGDDSIHFEVTTATILLMALAWLPAFLAAFVVVGQGLKAFGVEVSGGGLAALLEGFEFQGTVVHASAQERELAGDVPSRPGGPEQPVESDVEGEAEGRGGESDAQRWTRSRQPVDLPSWTVDRARIYDQNQHIFLAHRIRPSTQPDQLYDVSIFLVGVHGRRPTEVVERAEFFLGRAWGNRIFEVLNTGEGDTIGMSTAAYGPALCICRVVFRDGAETLLHRLLDFEMGWAFRDGAESAGVETGS